MKRRTIFAPGNRCDGRRKDKQGNAAPRPCSPSEEAVVNPAGPLLPNASGAGLSNVENRIAEIEAKYMRAAYGSDPWRTYWSGESGARMQQEYRGLLAAREQTRRGRAG